MTISSIAIGGTNAHQFAQTNNCPASLDVNATCTASVTFTPTSAGNLMALLAVNVAAPATSKTVALTGTGINPALAITVSPASPTVNPYYFGIRGRNTNTTATFAITSTGATAVTIPSNGVLLAAGSASRFSIAGNTCSGKTMSTGQTCTVSVNLKASAFDTVNGQVTINPASPAAPQIIYVRGTGL